MLKENLAMSGSPKDDDDLELSLDEAAEAAVHKPVAEANAEMIRAQIQEHGMAIAKLEKRTLKTEVQLREHWRLLRALRRVVKRILIFLKQGI